jgi:hypothetical protein
MGAVPAGAFRRESVRGTNGQGRTVQKINGHMVDSAANNTQRIIWLQLEKNPLLYPDYASKGNFELHFHSMYLL